ncbi:lantibiotic dehydratase [Antrihabitans sp. YC2-6]|uniref:lantibiotic dehydratase n=1 Tax=Antrihabitans sp. YC2-6 TaxID=2799498 RepID=UPI0018F4A8AB|nr:lantibiotic dehydratase [Antrihabitans sp. YC2-6]MBJ8346728.1 lantibiotic dehydratase [Antrihabitans sp. YC2-6]
MPESFDAQFFVLRAPLLPLEELDKLRADQTYWRTLVSRPDVREALYLGSPALTRRLDDDDPDDRVVASLTAYLVRMCTRATPFGLFAGCSLGTVGADTALLVDGPEGTTRRSRPDTEVLTTLVERLVADPATRPSMAVEPNSSRYHAAGALRLIESRWQKDRRTHHLVVVEDDAPLRFALEAATGGAVVDDVVKAVAAQVEVDLDEARDYVDALVAAKVLTPVAEPTVTGPEPLAHVLSSLRGHDSTVTALARVSSELAALDAAGLGNPLSSYESATATLREFADGNDAHLIQVDLHRKGSGLTLGSDTVDLITKGLALLHKVSPSSEDPALARFKAEFAARYADREVPLMEALDEELGIGFDRSHHPASDESRLLAGLDLGGEAQPSEFGARDAVLLDVLLRARESDSTSIELDADLIKRLEPPTRLPLPDAFAVSANLLGSGVEIESVCGPSGAELLGRFCHGDAALEQAVRAHLRAEEAHAPGVVFAELVHLPEGRIGNILTRPVLRGHELILLGRSGAPTDRQIGVDELTVRLDGDRIVLFCPRLGAEVRPRLTTAHNAAWRGFGVYRFLAALPGDGVADAFGWNWGACASAPWLPRVTGAAGSVVLSRARWRLSAAEIAAVTGRDPVAAWAELASRRGLPTELLIVDGDNRLYIDTASAALTSMAAKVLRGRTSALVDEVLSTGTAVGPQGRFEHELIVPFVRRAEPEAAPDQRPTGAATAVRRTFTPGGEWLYLKVYTGTATADRVLTGALGPVLAQLADAGVADRWFFLRYGDPDHHLRVRLHGEPSALLGAAMPALSDALAPRIEDGTVWKIVVDTYQREIERYGGDAGIELAEQIHAVDSVAVIAALPLLDGEEDARWKLCLYATDRLLADAGLDIAARRAWVRDAAAGYRTEYPNAPGLDPGIGARWRTERADLSRLLDDTVDHPWEPVREVFRERSVGLAPLFAELAARRDQLTAPYLDVVRSVSHLNSVRLLRSAARTHELVLLSFLERYYGSRLARGLS